MQIQIKCKKIAKKKIQPSRIYQHFVHVIWEERRYPTVQFEYKMDSEMRDAQLPRYLQNGLVHQFLEMLFIDRSKLFSYRL